MAQRHPLQTWLAPALFPLARAYAVLMRQRRAAYVSGKKTSCRPCVPTIAVGNISWGGTGKTPVTDWLLTRCQSLGLRAAVLTRGYGGKPPVLPYRVMRESPPQFSGDEPLMLTQKHPEAVIYVDPVRSRAAGTALAEDPKPEVILLDDGFQHLKMGRHIDLVLLDTDDLQPGRRCNWNRVLPLGTWREDESALASASAFLVKTTPDEWRDIEASALAKLRRFGKPVFPFELKPQGLRPYGGTGLLLDKRAISGDYCLANGVGSPRQVRRSVVSFMGREPAREFVFPDHHDYANSDFLNKLDLPLVCTAKDLVKLEQLPLAACPGIFALEVSARFFTSPSTPTTPDFSLWFDERLTNVQKNLGETGR